MLVMHDPGPSTALLLLALDGQGKVLQFAPSTERTSGYAAAEMLDADPFDRLFADDASRVRQAFLSGTGDEPIALGAHLQPRHGEKRFVHWSCWRQTPATDPVRYVVVGIDRTEERALEQKALQNARSSAAGILAAGLAHEIRNPLNGASLHLSVLERDLARLRGVSSSAHEAVAVVRSELHRLSSLVTDFLEVTRPRRLARTQTDVCEVVRSALALVQKDAMDRHIALAVDFPPEPVSAWIDGERLKRAVLNLVQNALEAVEKDGTIRIRLQAAGPVIELEVEDDGPGIGDAGAPIFDPFFTTKRTGTGLGLSIVHRTATDHGGDVTYASVPSRTVFRLTLPAKPDQEGV